METSIQHSICRIAPVDDSLKTEVYNDALKGKKGVYPVAVASGQEMQSILVTGDAVFMSNAKLLPGNIQTGILRF